MEERLDISEPKPAQPNAANPAPAFSKPSSSTDGFFQSSPVVLNQFYDDQAFTRALGLFLPSKVQIAIAPELSTFGDKVLTREILDLVTDAEKHPPYLKTWDSWGRRRDDLVTSEGWRQLSAIGIQEGMVAMGYENRYHEFSRVYHFAKYHLWSGSSAWTTCPNLMTDGVASLLRKHLSNTSIDPRLREVLGSAYDRITSRDMKYAWTTGQWMTERQGGSDVSQTETLAVYDPAERGGLATDGYSLGPWRVDGFKWFSSATDCNMTVFLARTSKGVSTFFAPMRRQLAEVDSMGYTTELNGIQIQRLKNKLGTRALPTAELVLQNMRAHLIGEEGKGTREIATVLNIARIHNAATTMGYWGRALGVVRAFGRCRKVGRRPLWEKAAYMRAVGSMHVEYRGLLFFTLFVAAVLGVAEQDLTAAFEGRGKPAAVQSTQIIPHPEDAEHLLRLLTPAVKGITAKASISGLSECMECLGGVGYLENEDAHFNIARLYRDANVCSIWEGTTDMMAHDVLRVVYGRTSTQVLRAMDRWLDGVCSQSMTDREIAGVATAVSTWWNDWKHIFSNSERGEVEMRAREIMQRLSDIAVGALLVLDALRDDNVIAREALDAWFQERKAYGSIDDSHRPWKDRVKADMVLVFGDAVPEAVSEKLPARL